MKLIVTKGDGVALADQKQAIEEFKRQASRSASCSKPIRVSQHAKNLAAGIIQNAMAAQEVWDADIHAQILEIARRLEVG